MFSRGCEGEGSAAALLLSLHCAGGAGEKAAPVALHESKGIFSFAKENIPFGTPRERL